MMLFQREQQENHGKQRFSGVQASGTIIAATFDPLLQGRRTEELLSWFFLSGFWQSIFSVSSYGA
jgi:hypothetical protein